MSDWRNVMLGDVDDRHENYGVFEDGALIAVLILVKGPLPSDACPSPYWSVAFSAVLNQFQGRGIGPRLYDAVFNLRAAPLASDTLQHGGGADMWRRWIRKHPGKVELHGPDGSLGVVQNTRQGYEPDPWASPDSRLVRKP